MGIDNNAADQSQTEISEAPPAQGIAWRLQAIFLEPSRAFEAVNIRPMWIVPLIICIVLSLIATAVIYSKVDMRQVTEQYLRESPMTRNMSNDEIRDLAQQQADSPVAAFFRWAGPLLSAPLLVFVMSGLLMLLVYLAGSETRFWKVVGVVSWSFLAYSLISSVLVMLVFSLSSDPQSLNLQNPLYTNLGHLLSSKDSPALYSVVSRIDLLTLYVLVLMGMGLSKVAAKVSAAKGFVLAFIPYGVYAAIVVFFSILTS
jgi:hypothetical protein